MQATCAIERNIVDLGDLNFLHTIFFASVDNFPGDMSGDGMVNFADLALFMPQLFANYRDPERNPSGIPNACSGSTPH